MKMKIWKSLFILISILVVPSGNAQTNWYKGQIHTHTTNSDGDLTLAQLVKTYRDRNYQFLVVTDHNFITPAEPLSSNNFLVFNGEEVTANEHWGALDLKTVIVPNYLSQQQIIDRINEQNAIPIINHPRWAWIYFTLQNVQALNNINHLEIFNTITSNWWDHFDYTDLWDEVLSSGRKMYGVAVDDFHHQEEPNHWLLDVGYIMVRTTSLTRANILNAIRNGDFYSSNGAVFNQLKLENGLISIGVESGTDIKFIGKNGQVLKLVKGSSATYQVLGNESYVRVEGINRSGCHVWSQPLVFFENNGSAKRLVYESGQKQTGSVNELLTSPLAVKLVNSGAQPVANERVLFQVTSGAGKFNSNDTLSVLTDAGGVARAIPKLGKVAGDSNQVFKVSATNVLNEVIFKATASAGAAAKLIVVSGNGQSAPNGQTLASPLVVKVTDQFDNLKTNQSVIYSVTVGSGLVNGQANSSVSSDADGQARVNWKLGSIGKEQQVKVSIPGSTVADVFFSANATSKPARISILSGNNQTAKVAKALSAPLVIVVVDSMGAAISGHPVLFEVTSGSGKVNSSTSFTSASDTTGRVSVTWTLGTIVGLQSVKVSSTLDGKKLSSTPDPLLFNATALPEAATKIVIKEGNNQTGTANHPLAQKITAQAQDSYGNVVANAQLFFRIKKGNGVVLEDQPVLTSPIGVASVTWILGPSLGIQELEVLPGGSLTGAAVCSATATKSLPTAIAIVSGNSQTGVANHVLKDSLVVVLKDETGGGVQGFPVGFAISAGMGALLNVNPDTTDSRGYAVMAYRPTNQDGSHRVRANSLDIAKSVEFQFTIQPDDSMPLSVRMTELKPILYQMDVMSAGSLAYIDRSYTVSVLPDSMQPIYLLKTANNDKADNSESFLTFTLDQPTDLYVAYDQRIVTPPNWLKNNFTQTAVSVLLSDKSTRLALWHKETFAGKVILGGNTAVGFSASGGYSMYLVLFKRRTVIDRVAPAPPMGLVVVEAR
jgi:hypothetical protein